MHIHTKIPTKLEYMPVLISQIIDKLTEQGVVSEKLFDIRLSLEEVIINAMKYGNKMDPQLQVEVKVTTEEDKLIMEIKDQGPGFNYDDLPDPTDEANLEKASGRGVFLIKNLMDEVEFFDNGSTIRMTKVLKEGA